MYSYHKLNINLIDLVHFDGILYKCVSSKFLNGILYLASIYVFISRCTGISPCKGLKNIQEMDQLVQDPIYYVFSCSLMIHVLAESETSRKYGDVLIVYYNIADFLNYLK